MSYKYISFLIYLGKMKSKHFEKAICKTKCFTLVKETKKYVNINIIIYYI